MRIVNKSPAGQGTAEELLSDDIASDSENDNNLEAAGFKKDDTNDP